MNITTLNRRCLALSTAIAILALLAGCAGNNFIVQRSLNVSNTFENGEIIPDYNYFYYGPAAAPDGILGIHKDYELQTKRWNAINLDSGQLGNWMSWYNFSGISTRNGYAIQTREGKMIGIFYSPTHIVNVWTGEGNQINVSLPRRPEFVEHIMPVDHDR
jgi:hypothetical protein